MPSYQAWTRHQQQAGQLTMPLLTVGIDRPARSTNNRVYYSTAQWQNRRKEAIERSGFRCELCSAETRLEVHHLNYSHFRDEWPDDLMVLCHDCHQRFMEDDWRNAA